MNFVSFIDVHSIHFEFHSKFRPFESVDILRDVCSQNLLFSHIIVKSQTKLTSSLSFLFQNEITKNKRSEGRKKIKF